MADILSSVPESRKVRLFVVAARGIIGGISLAIVSLALTQTYRAGAIVFQSELSVAAHVTDPTMFWLLIGITTIIAYALGGMGLYMALSDRLTSTAAVVGGE